MPSGAPAPYREHMTGMDARDAELKKELDATLHARRELGDEYDSALVDSFLEKVEQRMDGAVERRVRRQLAEQQMVVARGARSPQSNDSWGERFGFGIVSLVLAVPLSAIGGGSRGPARPPRRLDGHRGGQRGPGGPPYPAVRPRREEVGLGLGRLTSLPCMRGALGGDSLVVRGVARVESYSRGPPHPREPGGGTTAVPARDAGRVRAGLTRPGVHGGPGAAPEVLGAVRRRPERGAAPALADTHQCAGRVLSRCCADVTRSYHFREVPHGSRVPEVPLRHAQFTGIPTAGRSSPGTPAGPDG